VCFFIFIFFVSLITFWISKSASIFKLSPISDKKVNLVGTFGRSFFEIPNSFQKNLEKLKKKKNDGKTGIFTQDQFLTKSIFYMVVIQKLITVNTYNVHQMFMSVLSIYS
ncbi:Uncharacterized protein FWK35_00003220, partial [Aphis craccivora]